MSVHRWWSIILRRHRSHTGSTIVRRIEIWVVNPLRLSLDGIVIVHCFISIITRHASIGVVWKMIELLNIYAGLFNRAIGHRAPRASMATRVMATSTTRSANATSIMLFGLKLIITWQFSIRPASSYLDEKVCCPS